MTELSERARWYMDNFTPEQVAEFAAAQEQEVVALTAGAEPYDDESLVPTPGQWIMLFNRATAEQRLAMAALVLDDRARLNHYTWTERRQLTERADKAEATLAGIRALAAYYADCGTVWDGNVEEVGREFLEAVEGRLPEWLPVEQAS